VLYSVVRTQKAQAAILRIVNESLFPSGDIYIFRGTYVEGARLEKGNIKGYDALRSLLEVREGTYQYIEAGPEVQAALNQNLHVKIGMLINALPDLPDTIEGLRGQNTLDRIRARPEEPQPSEESLIYPETVQQVQDFEKKSMAWRALVFWGFFFLLSAAIGVGFLVWH